MQQTVLLSGQLLPRFSDGFMRIGAGPFGMKEESLNEHKTLLKENGFKVPRTVTIGWGTLERAILASSSPEFVRTMAGAHKGLGSPEYFAARSSAMGDNTGTGIFFSTLFRFQSAAQTAEHVRQVAASHSCEEALCFRRELGLPEGIGAMLQPIAGEYYDLPPVPGQPSRRVFGPLWSGIINTQLPQTLVMNPGLLRPETSENKTLLPELSKMRPDSMHVALLFDADLSSPSPFPIDVKVPGNILLQDPAIRAIQLIPERAQRIRDRLGRDFYAEVCVTTDGEARIVQFAPLPPLPELSSRPEPPSGAAETLLCRGAVRLERATALVVTDYLEIDDLLEKVREYSRGMEGRSLVLIFEDNILRGLMSQTKELWGSLRNVAALLSVNIQRHTAPFECHLAGAMRLARGFGYGRLATTPNLGEPDDVIICPRGGNRTTQIDVHLKCIDVAISEGHGAGYIARALK